MGLEWACSAKQALDVARRKDRQGWKHQLVSTHLDWVCLFFKTLAESVHLLLFIVMHSWSCCSDKSKSEVSWRSEVLNQWDMCPLWELQRGALSNSDVSSPDTVFVSCKIQKCVSACTHAHGHWSSVLMYWGAYIFHYWVKISTYSPYKVAVVWDEGAWGLFIMRFIGNTSAK